MSEGERRRPRTEGELPLPGGLGDPIPFGGDGAGGSVTIDYGVYHEQLPVGGRTVREVRRMFGGRYDIAPDATAMLDGETTGDDTVVRAGQMLRFLHVAGEKGQVDPALPESLFEGPGPTLLERALALRARLTRRIPPPKITIAGTEATSISPEGLEAKMDVETLLTRLGGEGPSSVNTPDLILPDGVKYVLWRRGHLVVVHQTPPAVHGFKWISADSKARHGPGTVYRQVRIALPYVIVLALFESGRAGELALSGANECFFRNEPLRSPGDEMCYPALLNCSKLASPVKPLSWICTQHLERSRPPAGAGINERVRLGLLDLRRVLLETGFNYSSEEHELSSWFSESNGVDRRVATVEAWECATREDPTFACTVPWLAVGMSVREVAERTLTLAAGRSRRSRTSRDVAQVLFNHGTVQRAAEEKGP